MDEILLVIPFIFVIFRNVKVRRAGFASRNPFERFLERFYMLSTRTCYAGECTWTGDTKRGCELILLHSGIPDNQWQLGKSKVFIKSPESVSFIHVFSLLRLSIQSQYF